MKSFFNLLRLKLSALVLLAASPLFAQQTIPTDTLAVPSPPAGWETSGSVSLNFSQVNLTNWAGGGQSSIAVNSIINLSAVYAKDRSIWENKLDIAYGLMRQGDNNDADFRKTDDLLGFTSKYNYKIRENIFITALTDFRTQFSMGYNYTTENGEEKRIKISDFMAPGFLVSSFGATYIKGKVFTATFSPISSKLTFVLDDSLSRVGAFGVEPGQSVRSELGAAFRSAYEREIYTNINFRTNLSLFANYETISRVDVNWEGILLLKVNKYITSTIAAHLIYDHDVIQKIQWRNAINVGFLLEI